MLGLLFDAPGGGMWWRLSDRTKPSVVTFGTDFVWRGSGSRNGTGASDAYSGVLRHLAD
jgi:hypothetical protein